MKVDIATHIAVEPDAVWGQVQRPELLQHIASPLIRFAPTSEEGWPAQFVEHAPVAARLFLFGFTPLGLQWIVPSLHLTERDAWPKRLRDNGYSRLIRRWDHWITVEPDGHGGTHYRDTVDVDAGLLTLFFWAFAQLFYRHRQRRWRTLAKRLSTYAFIWEEQAAFDAAKSRGDTVAAWEALKTIHIVAQRFTGPHWSSHIHMLRYAPSLRDWREVGGQLLRLALVPLGNATGRLPIGNHGRARVSPFQPMAISDGLHRRLAEATNMQSLPNRPQTDSH